MRNWLSITAAAFLFSAISHAAGTYSNIYSTASAVSCASDAECSATPFANITILNVSVSGLATKVDYHWTSSPCGSGETSITCWAPSTGTFTGAFHYLPQMAGRPVVNASRYPTLDYAVAAAKAASAPLYIPSGSYTYNNSSGPLVVSGFSNEIFGDGASSVIQCTTLSQTCISVTSSNNFSIYDMSVTYSSTPTSRIDGAHNLHISGGSIINAYGLYLHGGAAAGLIVDGGATNVVLRDNLITDQWANGAILSNVTNVNIHGLKSQRNQDAGLEFSTYGTSATSDITISNYESVNDYTGVLFNSTKRVTFSNFIIRDTFVDGIAVREDPATTTTVWPDLVNISNGTISGVGSQNSSNPAVKAINMMVSGSTPSYNMRISVSNVAINGTNAGASALFVGNDSHYDVNLDNIAVTGAGDISYNLSGGSVTANNLRSFSPTNYAFVLRDSLKFNGFNLSSTNAQQSASGTNSFLNLSTGTVNVSGYQSTETGATARGAVTDSGATGQHTFTGVSYNFADGTNPGVTNTYSNPNFSVGPISANGNAVGPIIQKGLSNNGLNMYGVNPSIFSGDNLILQSSSGLYVRSASSSKVSFDTGIGINVTGSVQSGQNTVSYSATPAFNLSLGNTQKITLTGNVTAPTLVNTSVWAGAIYTFVICQDATGSRTFAWPSAVHGGGTIAATASKCNVQAFVSDGTNLYALSSMVTGQ